MVDGNIKLSSLFCEMGLSRSLRPLRSVEAVEVIEATDILRLGKSLVSTPESSRLLNLTLF
jgi:hypothetical protein